MKTQRSRNTFDTRKRYSGVYQQQGRMITDADWNEMSDLLRERLNDVLRDVVGGGTPRHRGMVAVTDQGGSKSYDLQWGYAYVDGIVGQSGPSIKADPPTTEFEYTNQLDFPEPPPLPEEGDYCLYLDLWERAIVFFEDQEMRDPGLHGADTCTRSQTMLQVKWCPVDVDPEDPAQNYPVGEANLTLVLRQGSTEPDPCDPCASEIELNDKVGDYLFRVEVHDVKYSAGGEPEEVTLKWSSENGAEHYSVGGEPTGFITEGWVYDFFSGSATGFVSEQQLGYHLANGSWEPTRSNLFHAYPDAPPSGFPLVRRWDGAGVFQKNGDNWNLVTTVSGSDRGVPLSSSSGSDAPGHVTEGPSIGINLDTITLTLELAALPVLAGDYWEFAVRQNVHRPGDTLLDTVEPQGIVHHYLKLGKMDETGFVPADDEICRQFNFPPLTDIGADDVCYDNEACEMPGVDTVKDALDHLCQERDLRWHNKHLHGFGVVCGLQMYCAPPNNDGQDGRRGIRIKPGYALDCEGNDIIVDTLLRPDLIDMIEKADNANEAEDPILGEDGNGTACLSIELDPDTGQPQIKIEKYDKSQGSWSSLFEDTLLWDFYQGCIVNLIEAFKKHIDLSETGEGDPTDPKISVARMRLVSLIHLFLQFYLTQHGRYILISPKGHNLLRGLYEDLQDELRSQTFCAMFEGDEFPDYPFPNLKANTAFGKNGHTKVKVHPSGKFFYTYGGTNNLINVYDANSEELVAVHKFPAGTGSEVRAITFSDDGKQLFAGASLREEDTILGRADIDGKTLTWNGTVVLCDVIVTELIQLQDGGPIVALGKGTGVYALTPSTLFGTEKTELKPVFEFNAVGHLVIDELFGKAYATASAQKGSVTDLYDRFVMMDVAKIRKGSPAEIDLEQKLFIDGEGELVKGDDDLALGSVIQEGRRIHIVTNPRNGSKSKHILTYSIVNFQPGPPRFLDIENTGVTLMLHERTTNPSDQKSNRLLVGLAGSLRLMTVTSDGTRVIRPRIPVQVQPIAIAINREPDQIYVLNYLSNTVTMMGSSYLDAGQEFLNELAEYRKKAIQAFVALGGSLAQYLKDCFCQHLLVNCPTCEETDKVYLGVAEIRDREVYNICNFAKRKDVHTFPKVEYWLSLVPIIPLIKKAVEKLCCMVLPDQLKKVSPQLNDRIKTEPLDDTKKVKPRYPDKQVKRVFVAYGRADVKGEVKDIRKRGKVAARLGSDSLILRAEETSPGKGGIRKSALVNNDVEAAKVQFKDRGVTVTGVKPYDARRAGKYREFRNTPSRIPKGSKVELYERDGKVVFYSIVKDAPRVVGVSEEVKAEIKDLENRKASLSKLDEINEKIAGLKKQRSEIGDVSAIKVEIGELEIRKAGIGNVEDLSATLEKLGKRRSEVEDVSTISAEIKELETRKAGISDVDDLSATLVQLQRQRLEVADVAAVKNELNTLTDSKTSVQKELVELKAELDQLKITREGEQEKLNQIDELAAATTGKLSQLKTDVEDIGKMHGEISLEVAKDRRVSDVPGVTKPINIHLRELGIRTVEELSLAKPEDIRKERVLTLADAKKIIQNAKNRLLRQ